MTRSSASHGATTDEDSRSPWSANCLADQVRELTLIASTASFEPATSVNSLRSAALFHLNFLEHHFKRSIFPFNSVEDNQTAVFASDPNKRYLSKFVTSAHPRDESKSVEDTIALNTCLTMRPGGKPVMNQSALHGFHVFEGLQLLPKPTDDGCFRFGYGFMHEKVEKLVDGIIRIRFAIHLLKASVSIAHLERLKHVDGPMIRNRFNSVVNEYLPSRRSEAVEAVKTALNEFIHVNREEMIEFVSANHQAFFYVRVEAQGGNRESIGQGPIGVGQSTLQIYGQLAHKNNSSCEIVLNPSAPPRMHALAGPFPDSPIFRLLNNSAVHHGNMGHQHLSSEMAQPHGTDMIMFTSEIGSDGRLLGPFVAETNFSNVGFVYGTSLVFPENQSATYGLTQHVTRKILGELFEGHKQSNLISAFEYKPILVKSLLSDLREGKITGAFIMGSMPSIRPVSNFCVDETLSGSSISHFKMDHDSPALKELQKIFMDHFQEEIVWE